MAHSVIAELLGKIGILDERQVDAVMSRAGSHAGGHVVQQVAEMGYASEGAVARAISIELGLPRIDLTMTPPEPDALLLLDGRVCLDRLVLPVALRENGELLWLAMADPTDSEAVTFVRRKTQMRVRPAVAGPSEIVRVARAHYGLTMPRMSSAKGEHDLGRIEIEHAEEKESLGAIEIAEEEAEGTEAMEVVNVMDESASPLARIARQLGVEVPAKLPSQTIDVPEAEEADGTAIDLRPPALVTPPLSQRFAPGKPLPRLQPAQMQPPPSRKPAPEPERQLEAEEIEIELDDSPPPPASEGALSVEEIAMLESIRDSMEKSAMVLKALVGLCVEKGVFTTEEMARRRKES